MNLKKILLLLLALCLTAGGCGSTQTADGGESKPADADPGTAAAEAGEPGEPGEPNETEEENEMTEEPLNTPAAQAAALREELWTAYCEKERADETRLSETADHVMKYDGVKMKYGVKVVGKPDENGLYPLYIALHGGGSDPTGEINEDQWRQMATYYKTGVKNGVYVNPRAVRDTWDCHSNPESYPLYDRLIENMILFENVDPNRVYLLGFSAGGDGVYQITPRMTDRFAAANMSAGHPNGVKLENLYNMPLQLQVGEKDTAYNRNKVTAEYHVMLDKLTSQYGGGYIHRTNIHLDHGHNFADYDDAEHKIVADAAAYFKSGDTTSTKAVTSALRFADTYTRDPLPETVVWNLSVRAKKRDVKSFYWLSCPYTVTQGVITAHADTENNTITIEAKGVSSSNYTVLLTTRMFDFEKPVTIIVGGETYEYQPEVRREVMEETLAERGDPNYIFEDMVNIKELKNG
ncbi:MAG: hypothetical protein IKQ92_05755 [Clostridia bacterium]|nr:hypothetical protein [Clostridia bacterium]